VHDVGFPVGGFQTTLRRWLAGWCLKKPA